MRRKDRQMNEDFALDVIDKSEFGVLGIYKESIYTMPLSMVRDGKNLYFHSAPEGKKVDMIEDGDNVSVSFVSRVHVPNILSREDILEKIAEKKFAEIGSKVFTTEFESAHVEGKIFHIKDETETIEALMLIGKKYTPDLVDLAEEFIKKSLHRTRVYKIIIEEIKGKRKKFDELGEEMKFGRME